MRKILFGSGKYGRMALKEYDNVAYFCDNDENKVGTVIDGIKVIGFSDLQKIYSDYEIIITTLYGAKIEEQLQKNGIKNYKHYMDEFKGYYFTDELVVNPYIEGNGYINNDTNEYKISEIDEKVKRLYGKNILFNHIEIETINRCNGGCSFCPVSVKNDTRIYKEMEENLFQKIINELSEINYSGRIALFSNNEPLLDKKIIERHKYAREKLPFARFHLFSNGTLMSIDIFIELMKYLDELIIDNYHVNLELLDNCKQIKEYCEIHEELKKKVTIVLRNPNEILTSRGGDAPNKEEIQEYPDAKCSLPFTQMIIRPDGKVSLCCNDPLGRNTLGDVSVSSIVEVWNNAKFQMVRKCLAEDGRKEWNHCRRCDFFSLT